MARPDATLYVIPGSHACRAAMLMLEHKRVEYRTIELPTGAHPLLVRALGFPGSSGPMRTLHDGPHRLLATLDRLGTVPALRLDGRRVQTNRAIASHLEQVRPEPPLYPSDPELLGAVLEAERWADDTLQMAARRIVLAASFRGLDELSERGAAGRLGALLSRNATVRLGASRMSARTTFRAGAGNERELLDRLPALLDQVDVWIAAGVLGGDRLYTADMMIAPSLALLAYRNDLRDDIERRPAGELLERVLPEPSARGTAERAPSA
ncbi:MAG TPA: glutathione S-transferase N-terminal domain-containing protein [Solirubrobacteraceae bacterium]|jgi:glutathione S-transferase|nr:glutathione S-transferase N-terminal domain-containing protein [Solirubrobacteraceae bacterium]